MIKRVVSVFLFFSLLLLFSSFTSAKEKLYWMEASAPPFYITQGPLKGQGYQDLITDILQENLPQYEHISMEANLSRHYKQWKLGEPACGLAMYKTPEREEFALFSIPSVFSLPAVLIIKKERFADFGAQQTISLKELLTTKKIVIGRSSKRSYGAEFDKVMDTYGDPSTVFSYEGSQLSLHLMRMLMAGRIDALPGLPEEAMYIAETMGIKDQIMTLAVEENLVEHESMLSYVTCSKNEWGEKTIQAINRVLEEQRPTRRYRAAYERWLDPSAIEAYRKMYQEIFLQGQPVEGEDR